MTLVNTIAPVITNIASVAGAADLQQTAYASFWRNIEVSPDMSALAADGVSVVYEHAKTVSSRSRYTSIRVDSLVRTPHMLTFKVNPEVFMEQRQLSLPPHMRALEEITFRLYPHEVSLLEVSARIDDPPARNAHDEAGRPLANTWLDEIQDGMVTFTEAIAEQLLDRAIAPLIRSIRRLDRKGSFLRVREDADEVTKVLWASRSLLAAPKHRWLLDHWTFNAVGDEHRAERDALLDGSENALMKWLNYAFVDVAGEGLQAFRASNEHEGAYAHHYAGLRYAQYVYASLDYVGGRLGTVLVEAVGVRAKWELEALKDDLVTLSQRAELIIMERHDLLKYMNREIRDQFKKLLEAWDYDELVEGPVQFKIELCNRRLAELTEKRAARSTLVTDLILLGIGITSIAGIAIALTDFGRNSARDAISTVYDLGASGFTDWYIAQPIDVILLASAAASTVLIVLYLFFRRDNGS